MHAYDRAPTYRLVAVGGESPLSIIPVKTASLYGRIAIRGGGGYIEWLECL